MFSILKDVIAVPDIATLSTHHVLGISRYTYALKYVFLTVNKFTEESGCAACLITSDFLSEVLFQMLSLSNSQWQHWLVAVPFLCCSPLALVDLMGFERS